MEIAKGGSLHNRNYVLMTAAGTWERHNAAREPFRIAQQRSGAHGISSVAPFVMLPFA